MTRAQAVVSALRDGMGATAVPSVPATTPHASSSLADANAVTVCGAQTVSATVSVFTGSATHQMAPAPANQATGASSAGSRVLLGSMDKTVGTSKEKSCFWISSIVFACTFHHDYTSTHGRMAETARTDIEPCGFANRPILCTKYPLLADVVTVRVCNHVRSQKDAVLPVREAGMAPNVIRCVHQAFLERTAKTSVRHVKTAIIATGSMGSAPTVIPAGSEIGTNKDIVDAFVGFWFVSLFDEL